MQLLKGKINPVCLGVLKDTIFLGVYTCKHTTHCGFSPTRTCIWHRKQTTIIRIVQLPHPFIPINHPPFEITTSLLQNKHYPLCLALNDPTINKPQGPPLILLPPYNQPHPLLIILHILVFTQNCSSIILFILLRLLHCFDHPPQIMTALGLQNFSPQHPLPFLFSLYTLFSIFTSVLILYLVYVC